MTDIATIMRTAPVIPVLVIHDAAQARGIAEALVGGGLKVLEVTMRTDAALEVIRIMREVPGAIVGAGTVVSADTAAKKLSQHMAQATGSAADDSRYRDLADQLN